MQLCIRILQASLVGAFLFGCATQKKATTATTGTTKYSEDLSVWRPKVEQATPGKDSTAELDNGKNKGLVEPKYAVNKKLDPILDSINSINLRRNYIDGFTIQVYSGLKREDALSTKKQLSSDLPDLESEIHYAQPNFRVKVGKYLSRIDAQRDYVAIKKYFPTAIVIPDKVEIN